MGSERSKNTIFGSVLWMAIVLIGWMMTWRFSIAFISLFALIWIAFEWRKNGRWKAAKILSILALANILLFPLTLSEYHRERLRMTEIVMSDGRLPFFDKIAVYGLNLVIAIGGYPLYPEVAKETFYLFIPTRTGIRVFENDFFLKSSTIRKAISEGRSYVAFNGSEYLMGNPEARYALALNPSHLRQVTIGGKQVIELSVPVEYPKGYEAVLLRIGPLKISVEEALFWALQKEGWLHPYTAVWRADMRGVE